MKRDFIDKVEVYEQNWSEKASFSLSMYSMFMLTVKCFLHCCPAICLIFSNFTFSSLSQTDCLLPTQQYHGPCPVLCDFFQVSESNIYTTNIYTLSHLF